MFRFVTVVALFAIAMAQRHDFAYEDCGSQAKLLSAQIEPCNSDPCVIKRGFITKIHFSLISEQDSETAKLDAKFKLFGIMLPIPGLETDLCKGSIQCPMVKGQTYSGIIEAAVPSLLIPMESTVEFSILGDKGVSVCARTNIIVQ